MLAELLIVNLINSMKRSVMNQANDNSAMNLSRVIIWYSAKELIPDNKEQNKTKTFPVLCDTVNMK